MQQIAERHICSGCQACYNICPTSSIIMEYDDEGFLYPVIDNAKCIDCGKCKAICPVLNDYIGNDKGISYACINKDDEVRSRSSSGGVFSIVAEAVIHKGGVVFGAAIDKSLCVRHVMIEDESGLSQLRGSKYVQSDISDTYKRVKKELDKGRYVLFSGTPCQISGCKSYLGREYDRLIMLDIICHGVPSLKTFHKYVDYRANVLNADVNDKTSVNFRDKTYGWHGYCLSIRFGDTASYLEKSSKDLFMKAFLNNLCLRPSCYNCHSKSVNRESDITLADFWGVKEQLPEMFDNKGTSLVLVNSEKGRKLFEEISDRMIVSEVDFDKAVKRNISAYQSCTMPKERKKFMTSLDLVDFKTNVETCIKSGMIIKIKRLIKRGIKYVQK